MQIRLLSAALMVLFLTGSLFLAMETQAKSKGPKEYQQGKLLNISETKEKNTTYTTRKQKDGTTITTPTTTTDTIYHIAVRVGDMVYQGKYRPMFGGRPNFIIGDPVQVRLDGKTFYLLKPNGKELKAGIENRYRADAYKP